MAFTNLLKSFIPMRQILFVFDGHFKSRLLSSSAQLLDKVTVTFVKSNGEKIQATGNSGDSVLDVVINNNVDLDGYGACEGTLTCSTCHFNCSKDIFDKLPNASDEELDMLDLASDITETSRLGCQITLSEKLDGMEINVPKTIKDIRDI